MTSSGTIEQSYISPPAKPSVHRYFYYYYFFFTLSLSTRFSRYFVVVDFRGRVFNTRYTFVRINGWVVIFFVSRPWRRRRPTRAHTRQCHQEPCVSNQRRWRWRRRESELVFIARRTSRSHRNRRLQRGIENRRRILLSKDLLFVRSRHILFCIIYATVVVFRVWIHGQRSTNTVGVHCAREQVNKDRGQRE